MQTGPSLQGAAAACYQLQFCSSISHCRMAPPFQMSPWSLSAVTQSFTMRQLAFGLWLLGLLVLFHSSHVFSWSAPRCALPPPPVQAILQDKDHLYALCWYNPTDHAPLDLDANAINCNNISNIQTISQKQSHPAEPKLTPKTPMKRKPIKPLKSTWDWLISYPNINTFVSKRRSKITMHNTMTQTWLELDDL